MGRWGPFSEGGGSLHCRVNPGSQVQVQLRLKKKGTERNPEGNIPNVADGFLDGGLFPSVVSRFCTVSVSDDKACTCACRRRRTDTHAATQSETPMYSFLYGAGQPGQGDRQKRRWALPFRTGQAQFRLGLLQPALHFSNSKTQKRARAFDTGSHRQSGLNN